MIENGAVKIARSIRNQHSEAASEAVLVYSLIIVLNNLLTIVLTIGLTAIAGTLGKAAIILVAFAAARFLSGGAHLSSSTVCSVASALILTLLSFVSWDYWYAGFACTIVCAIIILIYAPSGLKGHSRLDEKYYPLLKLAALLLVLSNLMIQSSLLSAAFLAQSLTITKQAYQLVNFLERRRGA
ncbi:accessory gene regulator B family protein [Paenibacillus turpanensis]|uniref:accessory gene regulator B family protein n=1 Tax=Paenibacillus turpanensis TaxID=2689078 RepID=UPI001FB64AD4|nr:accessory gene regulator B family protein [Paenibacillus turpanensis]